MKACSISVGMEPPFHCIRERYRFLPAAVCSSYSVESFESPQLKMNFQGTTIREFQRAKNPDNRCDANSASRLEPSV